MLTGNRSIRSNVWRRAQSSSAAWVVSGPVSTCGGSPLSQRARVSLVVFRCHTPAAAGTTGCGAASSPAASSAASAGSQPSTPFRLSLVSP